MLATFNGALWIREQLDSILAQRDVTPYVVIRDDGSIDDTLKQIAQFSHDSRVHLLANVSPTHSAAQNFFALIKNTPASGFDLVAFSDQDDIWNPDKLIRAFRCLKQ
ncbi:glycosyl transferase family protein, partial [mine drainage metagenome]